MLQDRIAAIALAVGLLACLVSGLANRPVIVSETEATEEVGRQLRAYVERSGQRGAARAIWRPRTPSASARATSAYCIARDDRRRYFCLFIDTEKEPTEVRRDPSAEPNAGFAAPDPTRGR